MNDNLQAVWNLSKWRFMQTEAQNWLFSSRVLEVICILSGVCGFLFEELIVRGCFAFVTLVGYIELRARNISWQGFFDGYEQGFTDSAYAYVSYDRGRPRQNDGEDRFTETIGLIGADQQLVDLADRRAMDAEVLKGYLKSRSIIGSKFPQSVIPIE
ncbi:MAG: hypothetical protein ACJAVI_005568 [Candidatus Azotimanducaceae bacterium]|jgi:hypothetical protein